EVFCLPITIGMSTFTLPFPSNVAKMKKIYVGLSLLLCAASALGQTLQAKLSQQAKEIEPKMIEWRRHFHQYPELSNRETKTGARIAEQLKALGIDVTYPVAKTGVVGVLKGGKPGPVV